MLILQCLAVSDDKQCVHSGLSQVLRRYRSNWLAVLLRVRRRRCEQYLETFWQDDETFWQKSNEVGDSALKGLAHSIHNSYHISTG